MNILLEELVQFIQTEAPQLTRQNIGRFCQKLVTEVTFVVTQLENQRKDHVFIPARDVLRDSISYDLGVLQKSILKINSPDDYRDIRNLSMLLFHRIFTEFNGVRDSLPEFPNVKRIKLSYEKDKIIDRRKASPRGPEPRAVRIPVSKGVHPFSTQ